mgnify:CR=1 FL=1
MKKAEKDAILKWAGSLSDEELKEAYYNAVFDSLGSQTEMMYELGYDMVDIRERDSFEKYMMEQSDLLEMLCAERGIELWEERGTDRD